MQSVWATFRPKEYIDNEELGNRTYDLSTKQNIPFSSAILRQKNWMAHKLELAWDWQ